MVATLRRGPQIPARQGYVPTPVNRSATGRGGSVAFSQPTRLTPRCPAPYMPPDRQGRHAVPSLLAE